ncbi:MAG: hypothetical protein IKE18_07515 [Oscillospiraceae bacterium]|nr:hypothetical protein [Oscillospiraceae bacterium]
MYCPKCNVYNDDQAVYCSNCDGLLRPMQTYNGEVTDRQGEQGTNTVYRTHGPVNYPAYGATQTPVVRGDSTKNWAGIAGFVMGMIALLIPLMRFPIGIPGLVISIIGRKSENRAFAIAGIVLSSIGLLIGILAVAAILSIRVSAGAAAPFSFTSL